MHLSDRIFCCGSEEVCLQMHCANWPGLLSGLFKGYSWLYHILLFSQINTYIVEVHYVLYIFCEGQSLTVTRPVCEYVCLSICVCVCQYGREKIHLMANHLATCKREVISLARVSLQLAIHHDVVRRLSSRLSLMNIRQKNWNCLKAAWISFNVTYSNVWLQWTEIAPFIYLDGLETICGLTTNCTFFLMSYSAVSACLPSPSLRNLLICPVAMSSAEHAGKGMLQMHCRFSGLIWDIPYFPLLICLVNNCMQYMCASSDF